MFTEQSSLKKKNVWEKSEKKNSYSWKWAEQSHICLSKLGWVGGLILSKKNPNFGYNYSIQKWRVNIKFSIFQRYHKWATSLTWGKNRRKHFRVYVLQLIRGFPWPEMSSLNFNLNYCGRTFGDFRQRKAQYKLVKCTYFSKGPIWLWKPSIHQNDPP